jgi:serine protease
MFLPRNRQEKRPRRPSRQPLMLEVLEDRTLLSTTPTTILDLNGLSVDASKYSSTDILVQFQGTPGTPGGPAIAAGTRLDSQLPLATGYYKVDLDQGMTVDKALAEYRAEKGVLDAEPDYELSVSAVPNDPLFSQQWALHNTGQNGGKAGDDIHAEQAWNVTTGNPNIVVAVLDTGVDYNDADLADNIWINQADIPNYWYTKSSPTSGYNKIVYKWEIKTAQPGRITFADLNNPVNKGLVWDNNGDGRIDAGDLLRYTNQGGWEQPGKTNDLFGWNYVSNNNNPMDDNGHGTNVAGILGADGNNGIGVAGVDWHVQIMPVKFIGANGYGSVSDFIEALNYAVAHGAKITNNSWEGAPYSTALYDAFLNAQRHGVISVTAAGNEGANNDTRPDYPASLSTKLNSVVAVAATTNTDQLAPFSNYGPNSVALAAPGVNILSTLPHNRYGAMSGTSMAAPEVAGALALVWGEHPTWSYTQVINQVLNTTQKLPSLHGKVKTGGLLNLAAAVGSGSSTQTTSPSTSSIAPKTYTNNTAESIKPKSLTVSTIRVPAGATIGNVTVHLNVNYPADKDLYIYLISPTGKTIALDHQRGGWGANLTNTVFEQRASTPIGVGKAPFSGAYRPEASLSQLSGTQAGGAWRLAIRNYGIYTGTLKNWSLTITPAVKTAVVATAPRTTTTKTYTNSTAESIKPKSSTVSTIRVPAGATIDNVTVRLNIAYPYDQYLCIYLISPTGRTIALDYQRGGWRANLSNTVFSDQASTPIGVGKGPFSGTYRPEAPLSQLRGTQTGGSWRLAIRNYGPYSGTLKDWSLTLTSTT